MKFINNFFTSVVSWQGIVSIIIAIIASLIVFAKGRKSLSTRSVVAIGIGAALYGALSVISIPIGPNTSFRIAVALLPILGAIFGPIVGFLAGFIGHALNDAFTSGSVWWSWVFLSASIGLFTGFITFDKKFDVLSGKISKQHYIKLYVLAIVGMVVGNVIAYAGDVFFYGESSSKELLQVTLASVSNLIVIAVIGIPVTIAIAKSRSKNNNLELDK
ncbi:energy-coupling factor transport system substrate-specific component [Clostridium acidisoli DSM 12555]|uniref:Energy-coupling factor transport system substrate-specific component n=1 Tax=Clostridium acidisoli DSM 12555 TaxID=1121291 RepID=A0A1W1XFS8_9CLOT|nr:ECF-type riboflavin transporter substrate-binding protein [Clostridium acidisoli]SMC22845.1 energy-coupling factor transport system substrate-specific component [Clostridium acidisoli DSM 12555]